MYILPSIHKEVTALGCAFLDIFVILLIQGILHVVSVFFCILINLKVKY